MAIFQPTNITPDMISGAGNGTVLVVPASSDVNVSWSVNGSSPLVAYQIDFFTNDTASTPGQSTGKVTLATPFSPVAADGTQTRFSCGVPYSYFAASAVLPGTYTGKFRITQWWGATDAESVVQRSLSVYRINGKSSVSVSVSVNADGTFDADATFAPPLSDHWSTTLLWSRWRVVSYLAGGTEIVSYDTGRVWGATDYAWSPGALSPGTYFVEFTAESSQGEQFNEPEAITVLEDAIIQEDFFEVSCNPASGGVEIDVSQNAPTTSIPKIEGLYSITWDMPAALRGNAWSFVWEGRISVSGAAATVRIAQTDGTEFHISANYNGIKLYPGNFTLSSEAPSTSDFYIFAVTMGTTSETRNKFYYYLCKDTGSWYSVLASGEFTGYTQADIASVTVYTGANTIRWGVYYGGLNDDLVTYLTDGTGDPWNEGTWTTYYASSYGDKSATTNLTTDMETTLYRLDSVGNIQKISNIVYGETGALYITDYGAANGETYRYFAVSTGGESDTADITPVVLYSKYATPCFWEWTLIEAEKTNYSTWPNGGYGVVNVFRFRGNVASGGIGNGAAPSVHSTFTRYPAVLRDTQNRKSGTLSGLIGWVSGPGKWSDSNSVRDAIYHLSATKNAIFLRNRRGDFLKVAISGEITMTMNDSTLEQEITASVPWVEIGPVDGSVISADAPTYAEGE